MKKIIITVSIAVGLLLSCKQKDNAASKVKSERVEAAVKRDSQIKDGPKLEFDKTVYDFGSIKEGELVKTTFKVTNTGDTDLIIKNASATCGCTIPTWPKDPIKPGDTADLGVTFNTKGRENKQTKIVTLTTNTVNGSEKVTISGFVKK